MQLLAQLGRSLLDLLGHLGGDLGVDALCLSHALPPPSYPGNSLDGLLRWLKLWHSVVGGTSSYLPNQGYLFFKGGVRRRARGLLRGRGAGPIASGPCRIVLDSDASPTYFLGMSGSTLIGNLSTVPISPADGWPQVKMPRGR